MDATTITTTPSSAPTTTATTSTSLSSPTTDASHVVSTETITGTGGASTTTTPTPTATAMPTTTTTTATAPPTSASSAAVGGDPLEIRSVIAQFVSAEDGQKKGSQMEMPVETTAAQLSEIINAMLANEEPLPYAFYVDEEQVKTTLPRNKITSSEQIVEIVYMPQAVFRVWPVTRESGTLTGHTNSVISVQFNSNGTKLASGSGDLTVRLWDILTHTPLQTLSGHKDWVTCLAWSPDNKILASGSKDGEVRLWDADRGKFLPPALKGHSGFISMLAWEPLATNPACNRLASAAKDSTVRIWDTSTHRLVLSLSGHTQAVMCVKWGGKGLIYTGSRDRLVKVFNSQGQLVRTLKGHAHWVNTMALSTDFCLRTGAYDHNFTEPESLAQAHTLAAEKFKKHVSTTTPNGSAAGERLVTGSDDGTLILWSTDTFKQIARLTGHQQQVMFVSFSPDGRFIASGSYDKSVKVWDGYTGKFLATLRGHVGAVYQISWSSDSRMFVTGSKDSTMKLWDARLMKMKFDLPGHSDEVFTVDWAPNGDCVASGSFDHSLKIWRR
ncbi:notchless protein [Pelomyxa schiedti]|nr:notchless protein [Pelomyxa schiedti]